MIVIANSCNIAVHPVARHYNRTTFTQSIFIIASNVIRNNYCNLAKPMDLLSMMSSNGEKNIETRDKVFKNYFTEKASINRLEEEFGSHRIAQTELQDSKFTCTMCCRNWNRSHYPFLGCNY